MLRVNHTNTKSLNTPMAIPTFNSFSELAVANGTTPYMGRFSNNVANVGGVTNNAVPTFTSAQTFADFIKKKMVDSHMWDDAIDVLGSQETIDYQMGFFDMDDYIRRNEDKINLGGDRWHDLQAASSDYWSDGLEILCKELRSTYVDKKVEPINTMGVPPKGTIVDHNGGADWIMGHRDDVLGDIGHKARMHKVVDRVKNLKWRGRTLAQLVTFTDPRPLGFAVNAHYVAFDRNGAVIGTFSDYEDAAESCERYFLGSTLLEQEKAKAKREGRIWKEPLYRAWGSYDT